MICRIWRGQVPMEKAEEYRRYQSEVGPPGYRKIPGNKVAHMLGRDLGERYEIAMLTLWESWEAVRAFAGEPVDAAYYYERDFDFLIDPTEKVEHFEVRETAHMGHETEGSIVRLWRSRVHPERRAEARRFEVELGVPFYRRVAGNQGVYVLERTPAAHEETGMLTFWESLEAVREFAGDPPERASYDYYRARGFDYLIDPPDEAEHYVLLAAEHGPRA